MGGKKNRTKTKWRKVPLGDLVDDTTSGDNSRKSHDSADDGETGSETSSFCPEDSTAGYPEIQFFGANLPGGETPIAYISSDGHCYYQTSDLRNGYVQQTHHVQNLDDHKVSGCYVNGLWIPEAELHKHIPGFPPPDLGADLPHLPPNARYHHVPWVRLRPVITAEGIVSPPDAHFSRRPTGLGHKCCWRAPRHHSASPYWCHAPPNDPDDQGSEEVTSETPPGGYLYPGYAFGPPVFESPQVRQESPAPPSTLPLQDAVKFKRKKRRRKMKPDLNPNENEHSTETLYTEQQTAECNGYFDGSSESVTLDLGNPFPSATEEEAKHIEDFVHEFVYSTVAEAQVTLGRLLNGYNDTDLTEDSSLSMISTTDSLCDEESHCEKQSALEAYIVQLLRGIVDDALSHVKQQQPFTSGENKAEEESGSIERFVDDFLSKAFDDVRKSYASYSYEHKQPAKDFLSVDCNERLRPKGKNQLELVIVESENTRALEKSEYVESLVSSILASAIRTNSALQTDSNASFRETKDAEDSIKQTSVNISEPSTVTDDQQTVISINSSSVNLPEIIGEDLSQESGTSMVDVSFSDERYMTDSSSNWLTHTEALIKETEMELNRLQSKVSQTDQSIYKLAYDEDHSEAEEISEPNVPNIVDRYVRDRSEIIVHELDTGSEAGSEDVELLPHRYDSSSGLEKHLYVNKLSLAAELLRTKETIPYDEEFKMVVGSAPIGGRVNQGFEEDLGAVGGSRKSNISIVDSGVQSDESENEGAVEAKEVKDFPAEAEEETQEVEGNMRASTSGYRRFGGVLKGNPFPCWCCNVM